MASKWRVKLQCGHWSDTMGADMQAAVEHDGWTDCGPCGDSVQCTENWRYGGLTTAQTRRKLDRVRVHREFKPGKPKIHRSGMATVQVSPTKWAWWCRRCEGYKPPGKGYVSSVEQARSHFAEHRTSPLHQRMSSSEAMEAWVAEQAARAAVAPLASRPITSITDRKRRKAAS